MKDLDHSRFILIFWYIVGCTLCGLSYVFMITFLTVPEQSVRFADTSLGFFLGTLITSCLFYLTGGNPNLQKKPEAAPGTATVDLSATVKTNEAPSNEEANPGADNRAGN